MFSALRQGNPFYILEKGSEIKLKIGQVESVSSPKAKYVTPDITNAFAMNMQMVVDINVLVDNEKLEFTQVPSNLSIADFGSNGIVISENRESILAELSGLLQTSKSILDNIDYHKNIVDQCEKAIKLLNPTFAKEKEHEAAIEDLTSQINSFKNEIGSVKDNVSKILGILANAEPK